MKWTFVSLLLLHLISKKDIVHLNSNLNFESRHTYNGSKMEQSLYCSTKLKTCLNTEICFFFFLKNNDSCNNSPILQKKKKKFCFPNYLKLQYHMIELFGPPAKYLHFWWWLNDIHFPILHKHRSKKSLKFCYISLGHKMITMRTRNFQSRKFL